MQEINFHRPLLPASAKAALVDTSRLVHNPALCRQMNNLMHRPCIYYIDRLCACMGDPLFEPPVDSPARALARPPLPVKIEGARPEAQKYNSFHFDFELSPDCICGGGDLFHMKNWHALAWKNILCTAWQKMINYNFFQKSWIISWD